MLVLVLLRTPARESGERQSDEVLTATRAVDAEAQIGKLSRASDADIFARCLDPRRGGAQVVIFRQRLADGEVESAVAEIRPPVDIRSGGSRFPAPPGLRSVNVIAGLAE